MEVPFSESVRIEVPLLETPSGIPRERLLFQIRSDDLPRVMGEFQSLTGKTLSFAWIADEASAAIIVDHAPSIWVSRRFEELQKNTSNRIFREWTTGIWIEHGFEPACDLPPWLSIRKSNRLWLIRQPGEVLSVGDFSETNQPINLSPASDCNRNIDTRIRQRITPKFVRQESSQVPTLWIITEDALGRLTQYCRSAIENSLSSLEVASTIVEGEAVVLLRAINTGRIPPIVTANATSYVAWHKQQRFYFPRSRRLSPSLRRDIFLELINLDSRRVYWARELGNSWRLESVAEESFKPLHFWVEYRKPVTSLERSFWEQTESWDFTPFIEEQPTATRKSLNPENGARADSKPRRGLIGRAIDWIKTPRIAGSRSKNRGISEENSSAVPQEIPSVNSRLKHARTDSNNTEAETVRKLEATLQSRIEKAEIDLANSWSALATAYETSEKYSEAAICWMNVGWLGPQANDGWLWKWFKSAAKTAQLDPSSFDPSAWTDADCSSQNVRALAAWIVWAARQSTLTRDPSSSFHQLEELVRRHEHLLPVKAVWMTNLALAQRKKGDVLGLARTRDRIFERLMESGVSLELDTPQFLRLGDDHSRSRNVEACKWLEERRRLIQKWAMTQSMKSSFNSNVDSQATALLENGLEPERKNTSFYLDYIIAWGLHRLAEANRADQIVRQADRGFPSDQAVHSLLRSAFETRFRNLREGRSGRLPLTSEWNDRRQFLASDDRYFVDKFCEHSRILQPNPPPSAYLDAIFQRTVQTAPRAFVLNRLSSQQLNDTLPEILKSELKNRGATRELSRLTIDALRRITELRGESLETLFGIVPMAIDAARTSMRDLTNVIEHGMAAASYADRPDLAKIFVTELLAFSPSSGGLTEMTESLCSQTFRSLRRMGLRSEADQVLNHLAENLTQGQALSKIRSQRPAEWPLVLRTMLHVAAGWFYSGRDDQAYAVLEEAKIDLFETEISPVNRTRLALAYTQTLGQAPLRIVTGRLDEMFQRLNGLHLRGSANKYFCLPLIQLVESAIRAVVADELASGALVRKRLDADEFVVRTRIRDDLTDALNRQINTLSSPVIS